MLADQYHSSNSNTIDIDTVPQYRWARQKGCLKKMKRLALSQQSPLLNLV